KMNFNDLLKRYRTELLIIAGFLLVCIIYFSPMLSGKGLLQHDQMQFLGSAKEVQDYKAKTGNVSAWTNSMFGGMPTYQISYSYPKSTFIIGYIYTLFVKIPHPINTVLFYMLGMFLLLRTYGVDKWIAAVGGLAFAFSSYNIVIIDAGHVNQTYAIAFAPFVLAALRYLFKSHKYLLGTALLAITIVVQVKSNHVQVVYYTLLFAGFMLLYEAYNHIRQGKLMPYIYCVIGFVVSVGLGFGANFSNMNVSNEYATQTIRGKSDLTQSKESKSEGLDKDYALYYSYGKSETATLMFCDFKGGSAAAIGDPKSGHPNAVKDLDPQLADTVKGFDQYWGPGVGSPIYFGAIVCFLFALGLVFYKGGDKWWILAATILSIMLAWGKYYLPLTNFFFDHFPLYNKFRSVLMILMIAEIAFPLLGFIILDRLLARRETIKNNIKHYYAVFGVMAGIALIVWIMPGILPGTAFMKPHDGDKRQMEQMVRNSLSPEQAEQFMKSGQGNNILTALAEVRENITKGDGMRSFFLILLAGGLLWAWGKYDFVKREWVIAGIGLLIAGDLILIDRKFLNSEDFKPKSAITTPAEFIPKASDEAILKDTDPNYRVLNILVDPFSDATTSYLHKSIGGYHGAKIRRFQELRSKFYDPFVGMVQGNIQKIPGGPLLDMIQRDNLMGTINMLNTKYIITSADSQGAVLNKYACGNAWFIKSIKKVETADAELAALDKFNPKELAVVNTKQFPDYITTDNYDATGEVKQTKYAPDAVSYTSNSSAEQFIVFSEIYYNPHKDWKDADWKVTVDGKPSNHIRVNFMLRGMKIPAGSHTIEFKFEPPTVAFSENISLASSIAVILLVLGSIFMEVRRKDTPEPEDA
ncbi:MAG: hypothetical protein NTX03_08400, partial [Bacteroidetes bacterium]|nr:hypothetical protein [Bacteroidota bacterium]